MRRLTSRLLREPLLHFLAIGAAIFAAYGLVAPSDQSGARDRIVVTAGDIERLTSRWEKRWLRPPEPDELRGLVDEYIREEVFYREALALGLDRDDTVVRRHLRQKLEFLTQGLAAAREPETGDLVAWFEANRERYRSQPRVSFRHVYFNLDRRGAAGEREAQVALAALRSGTTDATQLGDSQLLQDSYRDVSLPEVAATFGPDFAEALTRIETGVWTGPVVSGYGLHVVHVERRSDSAIPTFAEVEQRVRNDWVDEQTRQANEAVFERLLSRYDVVVEGMETAENGLPGQRRAP
jgi:hypothetical protein